MRFTQEYPLPCADARSCIPEKGAISHRQTDRRNAAFQFWTFESSLQ